MTHYPTGANGHSIPCFNSKDRRINRWRLQTTGGGEPERRATGAELRGEQQKERGAGGNQWMREREAHVSMGQELEQQSGYEHQRSENRL